MTSRVRTTRALSVGLLLAIVCLALPGPALGKAPRPSSSYWGAWIGPQLSGKEPPADMSAVARFAQLVGKTPSLVEISEPFANCIAHTCYPSAFPTTGMQRIREYGAIPVLSWSSLQSGERGHAPQIPLSALIGGAYDLYIRSFAEAARSWGHPFFLRFNWEMNGNWMPYFEGRKGNHRGQFVAAWRHVHDIFTSVGATNATWVWCPYADRHGRIQALKRLYPGGGYVDWTCIDAFNWGRNPTNPAPWMTFGQIFDSTYRQVTRRIAPHKPVMIAELGSTGSSRAKAAWIRDMFRLLATRYRSVRAIVWFEKIDRGANWLLEGHPAATRAFSRGIQGGYLPGVYGDLSESPILPPGRGG